MIEGVEIRTQDPDLGSTIALWLSDLLVQFHRTNPSTTVVIDDERLAGRPFRNGFLGRCSNFRGSRNGSAVCCLCSSSSIVFPSRPFVSMARKALVRLQLVRDAVPLDHMQVIVQQQRIRRAAAGVLGTAERQSPARFLLRVDDFPSPAADVEHFLTFHRIAREHGLPYLLAVTPFAKSTGDGSLSVRAVDLLRRCTSEGAEVALHGFSHRSRYRNYSSELATMPVVVLRAEIDRADEYLSSRDLMPVGFVAPFNTYDPLTFGVLAARFRLICGGPESVLALGHRSGPSFLLQRLYVPSYRDAYDVDSAGLRRFDRLAATGEGLVIPVTLHWANETRDDFRGFRALCERLRGRTMRWTDFVGAAETINTPPRSI